MALSDLSDMDWGKQIEETAASFVYPPTPDIAGAVRQRLQQRQAASPPIRRQLAWAAIAILLLIASLMLVPQVRAAVVEMLRAGAINIFITDPTPTTMPEGTPFGVVTPGTAQSGATVTPPVFGTPSSLSAANDALGAPLRLPQYPADLGTPDAIYLDESTTATAVVSVWYEPDHPGEIRLLLYQVRGIEYATKRLPGLEVVQFGDGAAFWIEDAHGFRVHRGEHEMWRFVEGKVLIWIRNEVTYRLEGMLTKEQALRIARSLAVTDGN